METHQLLHCKLYYKTIISIFLVSKSSYNTAIYPLAVKYDVDMGRTSRDKCPGGQKPLGQKVTRWTKGPIG